MIKGLKTDSIELYLIEEENQEYVFKLFEQFSDSDELISEIKLNYLPEYSRGLRDKFGFYAMKDGKPVGLSLLGVSDWHELKGYTGADTPAALRGRGIAPSCKPHLFYMAFEILKLNRVETGCRVSNISSKKSIEKTPGFQLEGVMRESGKNDQGIFEDEYLYAILKKDWEKLYNANDIEIIF